MDDYSDCCFHGPEVVTETAYDVCWECGHVWEPEALLKAHNAAVLECLVFVEDFEPVTDLQDVICCPECLHDF